MAATRLPNSSEACDTLYSSEVFNQEQWCLSQRWWHPVDVRCWTCSWHPVGVRCWNCSCELFTCIGNTFTIPRWQVFPAMVTRLPCMGKVFTWSIGDALTLQGWGVKPAAVSHLPCIDDAVTLPWWHVCPAMVTCFPCRVKACTWSSGDLLTLWVWGVEPAALRWLPCTGDTFSLPWWHIYNAMVTFHPAGARCWPGEMAFNQQWWLVNPAVVRCSPCEMLHQLTLQ